MRSFCPNDLDFHTTYVQWASFTYQFYASVNTASEFKKDNKYSVIEYED